MIRHILLTLLGLAIPVLAQPFLQAEDYFFNIPAPGLESLSTGWFLNHSDSTDIGFRYPVDVELLKLAPTDYRLVILDAFSPHLSVFRIDQQFGSTCCSFDASGNALGNANGDASA